MNATALQLEAPAAPPFVGSPVDANCARHPDVKASGTCHRCGAFVCKQDFKVVDAHVFCPECAVRPDVDYLEGFRLTYWGKRDSWAWLFGAGGILNVLSGLGLGGAALVAHQGAPAVVAALTVLAVGVNGIVFWLGKPIARVGVFVGLVALGVIEAAIAGPGAVGGMLIPTLVAISVVNSTRNKLFFKMPVTRDELKKAWTQFHDNAMARNATVLGVGGLLIPVLPPVAIICGVIGLKRVNPAAHPPIGNKGRAVAGIVLGVVGTLLWGGIGALVLFSK